LYGGYGGIDLRPVVAIQSPPVDDRDINFAFSQKHMAEMLRKQLLDSTRGRIVALLRGGGLTAEDIASNLGLTQSAVRLQISAMERDGLVTRTGKRPGATRPSRVFELTLEVEQLLSKAYVPLLTELVQVFADALPGGQLDALLRQAGRGLATQLSQGKKLAGSISSRVAKASEMLNQQLGAMTHVETNGGYVIRGVGCPLAALTGKHPGVCLAMESLVTEVVGSPVHECCDRAERPRCCLRLRGNNPPE
jgi:predicted ArsR family transcriptional regulator